MIFKDDIDSIIQHYVVSAQENTAGDYVELAIGVLTTVVLLLLGVFLIVIVVNHRHKLENSPTAILKNPFGVRSLKSKVSFCPIHVNLVASCTYLTSVFFQ